MASRQGGDKTFLRQFLRYTKEKVESDIKGKLVEWYPEPRQKCFFCCSLFDFFFCAFRAASEGTEGTVGVRAEAGAGAGEAEGGAGRQTGPGRFARGKPWGGVFRGRLVFVMFFECLFLNSDLLPPFERGAFLPQSDLTLWSFFDRDFIQTPTLKDGCCPPSCGSKKPERDKDRDVSERVALGQAAAAPLRRRGGGEGATNYANFCCQGLS